MTQFSAEQAEIMALQMLGWLAAEPEILDRFAALTGITPSDIAGQADNAEMLGGLMDFILQDEELLTQFCTAHEIDPETPALARQVLPGGAIPHWT